MPDKADENPQKSSAPRATRSVDLFRPRPLAKDTVRYTMLLADGSEHEFVVDTQRTTRGLPVLENAPAWAALEFHRCPDCPYDDSAPLCPTAADLVPVVEPFHTMVSFDRAHVIVDSPERTIVKDVDVQTALRSLLGLVMATSACPVLFELRALAENHLPFATPREATYRVAANHLLKQYFRARRGEAPDLALDDLRALYAVLQRLNSALVDRLRTAAKSDANLNALVLLFSEAALVEASLDDDLRALERLFDNAAPAN
jgi:hypothetical protein